MPTELNFGIGLVYYFSYFPYPRYLHGGSQRVQFYQDIEHFKIDPGTMNYVSTDKWKNILLGFVVWVKLKVVALR